MTPLYIDFAYRLGWGWASWLISFFGGGGWSHVDIVGPDGRYWGARSDVIGGQPAGFWPRPCDYEQPKKLLLLRLLVTADEYALFWQKAESIKGDLYNKDAIYGFAADRHWSHKQQYFCSQASVWLKEEAGISHKVDDDAKVTPGEDKDLVEALGATRLPLPDWFIP